MRKWIGAACVILGILSLLGAVGLVMYNRWDAENAEKISESFLKDVQIAINTEKVSRPTQLEQEEQTTVPSVEIVETVPVPSEMATVQVDGYDCIGILSIPALELDLPVLTDWSYTKLKKAPCLYYGTYYDENFVII